MHVPQVFITGATGYIGRHLTPRLLARNYDVRALARASSQHRLPPGCVRIIGDALNSATYAGRVPIGCTFVHLIGVAHPSPAKKKEFREIDLAALREAVKAASAARCAHFVFVSVAQPAPVMQEYQAVRAECENAIRASGMNATIFRPWYVLGPGHHWPYLVLPLYWVLGTLPSTRESARPLGLVKIDQMARAMVAAIDAPANGVRIVDVAEIRRAGANVA